MNESRDVQVPPDEGVLEARRLMPHEIPPVDAESNALFTREGELRPAEILFRVGLLLGAALFLLEGQGPPWTRGPLAIAGAFAMASLIVFTMVLQWRVLGDWRRSSQRLVLCCLIITLVFPITAVISPELSTMGLPETIKSAIGELRAMVEKVPGLGSMIALVQGIVIFLFFMIIMVVLIATSGPNTRVGFALIAIAVVGAGIFIYPTPETAVGMMLLAFFFRMQWERPLLLPDAVRERLSPAQIGFLRQLVHDGSLSTGETKLMLDQNPMMFAELVDYRLAEYDSIAREVIPGRRLLHDPACETLEKTLGIARRGIWFLLGIIYFVMPDLVPGPIDDFVVLFLCSGAGLNWFNALFRDRKRL